MSRAVLFSSLGISIVVIVGFVLWWISPAILSSGQQPLPYNVQRSPAAVLQEQNAFFSEGVAHMAEGEYTQAQESLGVALENSEDRVQAAQIRFKIAAAKEATGEYRTAIAMYKELLESPDSYDVLRAYAALRLAYMILTPGAQPFLEEVFRNEPYASLRGKNRELTKKKFFEYASSFYPLPQSEIISATWYADQLLSGAVADEDEERYLEIVRTKLMNADADMPRIQSDENESIAIPEIAARRAVLVGKLALLKERTHDDAVDAFSHALTLTAIASQDRHQYTSFFYARYLAEAGYEDNITAALAPILEGTLTESVRSFFSGERQNRQEQKKSLQKIAELEPKFKNLLKSLGWEGIDFSS